MPRRIENRNLNNRQLDRIQASRDRRQAQRMAQLAGQPLGDEEPGRVVAHFGLNVEVMDANGQSSRCAVRENLKENPICGDQVIWRRSTEGQGVIETILPRRNLLQRPGFQGKQQSLAANVDQMIITTTVAHPNPGLIDRYLIAAEMHGIQPVVVINKADLEHDKKDLKWLLKSFRFIGYPAFKVSTLDGQGLEKLAKELTGKVSIFVGMSGVGKSSLVNHWIPDETIRIGEVNADSGKGRHMTTVARAYPLANGGTLIDSPGIRSFGLFGIPVQEVPRYFREIAPLIDTCQFTDCGHLNEPGCKVVRAVKKGYVDMRRFESMHRIMESMQEM